MVVEIPDFNEETYVDRRFTKLSDIDENQLASEIKTANNACFDYDKVDVEIVFQLHDNKRKILIRVVK